MRGEEQLDVGRVWSAIADKWYVVLLSTVLVGGAAFVYVQYVAKPVFQSTALVTYQEPSRDNPTGGTLPSTGITRENVMTLIGSAGRPDVVAAAAKESGLSVDHLRKVVQVQPHGEASIIDFVAKAPTAKQAAQRANAYANAFVADRRAGALAVIDPLITAQEDQVKELGAPKAEDPAAALKVQAKTDLLNLKRARQQWVNSIQLSTEAQPPIDSIWPKKTLTMFAALLVGLGLGCVAALLTARVDRRLQGDAWDELPAPVLVRVPKTRSAPKNAPLGPDRADAMVGDAFAALGARIMLDRVGEGAHVVLITSARSGEGKSTVAANLASALAQGGRRVILVDADMRKPKQAEVFPVLHGRPGLSQILVGATQVEHALTLIAPNLAAVASGPRQSNASVLLASVNFRNLVERLTNICEVIIIDAPPVLAVSDALAMAPMADQVLLCARIGESDANELEETHNRLAGTARVAQAIVLLGTERPTGYGYDGEDLWPQGLPVATPSYERDLEGIMRPPGQQQPPGSAAGGSSGAVA